MKVAIYTRASSKDKGQDVENQRRFAMLEDLQEHQETCESALAIDPADAAEELAMRAAEDAACE
jgi:predicted site-specific integrase-resolvase